MKPSLVVPLLCSFFLTACTVQSQSVPSPEVAPETPPVDSAPAPSAAQDSVRPEPVAQPQISGLANQLDQLSGRLTLVQEQIINQRNQVDQQLELSQAILQRLQLLTQSTLLQDQGGAAPADPAAVPQLDAAIEQLLQIANEIQLSSSSTDASDWEIVSAVTAKGWVLIRYQPRTGQAWLAENGGWTQLSDSVTPSAGQYRLHIERRDSDSKGYVAVRINRNTGATWWLNDRTWQAY